MARGIALISALALTVAACLWYVTAPPKGADGYRDRTASTAETLRSHVETSRIWARSVADGKVTRPAALIGFLETERDASEAASDFEAFEPPDGAFGLRSSLTSLSTDVTEALGALRIAAEQERWTDVPKLARPLARLSAELGRLQERARS